MRFLLLALLFNFQCFGQGSPSVPSTNTSATVPVRQDMLKYAQQLQQGQIDQQLQDMLKTQIEDKCKEKTTEQDKMTCIESKFKEATANMDEVKLKELSQKLNLSTFNLIKSEDSNNIRSFLNFRLCENLQGTGSPVCIAQRKAENGEDGGIVDFNLIKLVDQVTYHDLYQNQLGKNLISDISEYCLDYIQIPPSTTTAIPTPSITAVDKSSAKEREEVIKNEIQNGGANSAAFLKTKFDVCAGSVDKICDGAPAFMFVNPNDTATTVATDKACLLRNKLRAYRRAIAEMTATSSIYDQMKKDGGTGFALSATSAGKYGNENNDKITTFTSSEVAKAMNLKDLSDNLKYETATTAFNKECAGKNEEELLKIPTCKDYISKAKLSDIERQKEFVQLKDIATASLLDKIAADSTKLKDYLKENGFNNYIKELEDNSKTASVIVDEIKRKFSKEKQSIICEINAKAGIRDSEGCGSERADKEAVVVLEKGKEDTIKISQTATANIIQNVQNNILDTAKSQESLFRYNNIVSSYLTLTDKTTGQTRGTFKSSREREIADLKSDPSAGSSDTKWFGNVEDKSQTSGSRDVASTGPQSGPSVVDLNFIDQLLGTALPTNDGTSKSN